LVWQQAACSEQQSGEAVCPAEQHVSLVWQQAACSEQQSDEAACPAEQHASLVWQQVACSEQQDGVSAPAATAKSVRLRSKVIRRVIVSSLENRLGRVDVQNVA
jgi:hypothetical protein